MQFRKIELNEIVCIEIFADNPEATVHMQGGQYFRVPMDTAKEMNVMLKERLLKVMSVFGDTPQ